MHWYRKMRKSTYEYVLFMVYHGTWQHMTAHCSTYTSTYWYILIHMSEYKLQVCPAGISPAISLHSEPGKRWIGCLCRQIHKCMHKLFNSWSWRQSLLLQLAGKLHAAAPGQSLWRPLLLAGKPLAAVAEAETAAGQEDRTTILRTAQCQ